MVETPSRQRRHWADVLVILVGLALFGLAVWFPPFSTTDEAGSAISLWPVYASAGGLALAALFIAQRWTWRTFARVLLFAAAVILITGLFRVRQFGLLAWLTLAGPALLLLLATPFFGPMPRAADTGRF